MRTIHRTIISALTISKDSKLLVGMKIILLIAQGKRQKASVGGLYPKSTINSDLEDVGFLHYSFPNQTPDIANRHFRDQKNVRLLFIDAEKVNVPVQYEGTLKKNSGSIFIAPGQREMLIAEVI